MKLNMNDFNKNEVNQSQHLAGKAAEISTEMYKEESMMYLPASAILENNVLFQIEYHFSDANLAMDNYLLSRMHEDPDHWVSVKTVANLTKIKTLTDDERVTLNAIRKSKMLVLNKDESKVKRPDFEPPKPKPHKDLRRTVFIYGLPSHVTKEDVIRLCSCFGEIKAVALDHPDMPSPFDINSADRALFAESVDATSTKINLKKEKEREEEEEEEEGREEDHHDSVEDMEDEVENEELEPPDRETAEIVMMRKFGPRVNPIDRETTMAPRKENDSAFSNTNGECANVNNDINGYGGAVTTPPFPHPILYSNENPCDFSRLRTAFVVFKSQSQANKCVRGRMRSSDGIRAMHQYDFNKQRKKTSVNKARGMSPLLLYQNHSVDHSSRSNQFHLPNSLLGHQSQSSNSNEIRCTRFTPQKTRDLRAHSNRENRDRIYFPHRRYPYPRCMVRSERPEVPNVPFSHVRSHPFYKHNDRYCSSRDLSTKRLSDSTNWRNLKKSRNDLFGCLPQISDNESAKQTMAIGPDSETKGFNWPRNHRPRNNPVFDNVINTVPVLTTPVFSYLISGTGPTLNVVAMPIASLTFPTATTPMMYTPSIGNISAINK